MWLNKEGKRRKEKKREEKRRKEKEREKRKEKKGKKEREGEHTAFVRSTTGTLLLLFDWSNETPLFNARGHTFAIFVAGLNTLFFLKCKFLWPILPKWPGWLIINLHVKNKE